MKQYKQSAKPGRPKTLKEGRRFGVYLDAETIAKAERIGYGNASEGIRVAIREYKVPRVP